MGKFVINEAAVERVLNQAAQKIQNDPALRARTPAHVKCDAPGCPERHDLPAGILARSPEDRAEAVRAAGWSLDGRRTHCPAHAIHIEP